MDTTPFKRILEDPERAMTLVALYVVLFIVSLMLVVFIARGATTEMQKGVIAKTLAFNMMVWRVAILQWLGLHTLPYPWGLIFWVVVLILMLYFGRAFWNVSLAPVLIPRVKRSPWIYGAFALLCILFIAMVLCLGNRA